MNKLKLKAVGVTSISTIFLLAFGIYFIESYGALVFIFSPFLMGFLPSYIILKSGEKIKKRALFFLSLQVLGVIILIILLIKMEGLICILMTSPLILICQWIGVGSAMMIMNRVTPKNINLLLIILGFVFSGFDYSNKESNQILTPITTTVVINAPIEKIWDEVIAFGTIAEPEELLFKTGISYPINAKIKGEGVGAIRYCNFTTGSFVEPITKWEKPTKLSFSVTSQPTPMHELNPFWEIQPPHLNGYFLSKKGEFNLKSISAYKTELSGTTWYTLNIKPLFYWGIWTNYILHSIHERVLNHIKQKTEASTTM
ncbi:hypothetical protein EI427_00640 [Flammeovirga pectinis]|uniref:SRPBCC family protein n=1 Tax=Flammeovirga pectinis TaxID=2494373 RepID=A0A3S9NXU3_9BACT|nr:hypothetical protein [Flammeovirga pectinis]AZQ60768.1 hypothetical protein EI427_00640 [Flammeovirga pectinis]